MFNSSRIIFKRRLIYLVSIPSLWLKAKCIGHPMRLELTSTGLPI